MRRAAVLIVAPDEPVAEAPSGEGEVESFTVVHNNKGLYRGMVVGRLVGSGERFVAISEDEAVMEAMMQEDWLGKRVAVATDAKGRGVFEPQAPGRGARL